MPREILGHREQVARLRTAAPEIAVLQMRRCDDQRVPCPLSSRKTGPCVGRPCRRMRTAIEVNHPVHRPPPLDMVGREVSRYRVDFLLKPRPADSAPLVRRRMRPALIFRDAPYGFGRSLGSQPACSVERSTKVVAQRRLTTIGEAVLVIL